MLHKYYNIISILKMDKLYTTKEKNYKSFPQEKILVTLSDLKIIEDISNIATQYII